jgi:thiol-disulfide isomerase/thioredoxin
MTTKFSSYFSPRNIMLLLVTIFLVYIIATSINKYVYPMLDNNKFSGNKEFIEKGSDGSSVKDAEILFFYADWCPHCKQAKPEWAKFKEEYHETEVSGYRILCIDVNCTSELGESGQLIKTYDVEGFPTIKMKANGKVIEYEAKVSKQNLDLFVKKML